MSFQYKDLLVLAPPSAIQEKFRLLQESLHCDVDFAYDFASSLPLLENGQYKTILVDITDKEFQGLQLLEWIQSRPIFSTLGVLVFREEKERLQQALQLGPVQIFFIENFQTSLETICEHLALSFQEFHKKRNLTLFYKEFSGPDFEDIAWVGSALTMRRLLEEALALLCYQKALLVYGESGVGKKEFAKLIYFSNQPAQIFFVRTKEVSSDKQKIFLSSCLDKIIDEKTVFFVVEDVETLDTEIQERFFAHFIGKEFLVSRDGLTTNINLIGTTESDINKFVSEGRFHQDLAALMQQQVFLIPPLRDRSSDISFLTAFFFEKFTPENKFCCFADDALHALQCHSWPGNVRELISLIQDLLKTKAKMLFQAKDLPKNILQKSFYQSQQKEVLGDFPYKEAKKRALKKFNKQYILDLLHRSDQNLTVAAEQAGMDRSNFKKIVKRYTEADKNEKG